jgi:tetratricopeptide (TPR) repeat protein
METWTKDELFLVASCAYALYREGRYPEAGVIFEGLVSVDPANVYCRDSLASIYLLLGNPQRALEQLNAVLALDPHNVDARARRCEAWQRLGRSSEARHDLEKVAESGSARQTARLRLLLEAPPGGSIPAAAQLPPGSER